MSELVNSLRAARLAAGVSLSRMSRLVHYSKAYLSLIETGRRAATPEIVRAYERVLGLGGSGDPVNRRDFLAITALAAANATTVTELAACVAGRDPVPLSTVQTTYGVDRAVAAVLDRRALDNLRRWAGSGGDAVTRVNAVGILAKVPDQSWSEHVVTVLRGDDEVRNLYLMAVVARVCGLERAEALRVIAEPARFPSPSAAAGLLTREVVNPADAGARWCSALMLQRLSPLLGR